MGEGERSRAETQAHNISSRQKENRGGAKGTLGKNQGSKEVMRYFEISGTRACERPCLPCVSPANRKHEKAARRDAKKLGVCIRRIQALDFGIQASPHAARHRYWIRLTIHWP